MTRPQFDFGFAFLTNPAFTGVDEDKESEFYCMINYQVEKRCAQGRWIVVDNEQGIIQPYYSAQVKSFVKGNKYPSYLFTGGVIYDGRKQAEETEFQIPRSTNYCYKIEFYEDSFTLRMKIKSSRAGRTIEKEINGKLEEIQEEEDLVPSMNFARHNHMLFQIPKSNPQDGYLYYAIGGQEFSYYEKDGKIQYEKQLHKSCEVLDEQQKKWVLLNPMINERAGFSGFVSLGKIYVFGGLGQEGILGANKSEVYDPKTNTWVEIKIRWRMGMQSQLLGALCIPLQTDPSKILIIGGSKESGPTDQITILDTNTLNCDFLKNKVKLEVARAKMHSMILENQDSTNLVIFGGGLDDLSTEAFKISNEDNEFKLVSLGKLDVSQHLITDKTSQFQCGGFNGREGWVQASRTMPLLLYSDSELQQ